jgi:6,7-dimethyl-8-ribityllumazine synthase
MSSQRFAVVAATFYRDLADRLIAGAESALRESGDVEIDVFEVPGAFELPFAANDAAISGRYAGVVCVGAVIRGETDHYEFVCGEAARGIMDVSLNTGVPCGFGVLTVDSHEQALARSGGDKRDSGRHAADAVLAQLEVSKRLESDA